MSNTVTNVIVSDGYKTELDVAMVPVTSSVDTTNPENSLLYPNPSSTEIKAVLPQWIMGSLKVRIIDMAGSVVAEYPAEAYKGIPLIIDVSRLPGGAYTVLFTKTSSGSSCYGRFIVTK